MIAEYLLKAASRLDEMEVPDMDRMAAFECDKCGRLFLPEPGCYIGPKDRNDESCSPFVEWENLCGNCNVR